MSADVSEAEHDESADPLLPTEFMAAAHSSIATVLSQRPGIANTISPFHPLYSATLVAGLLLEPELHAHTVRVELLVHVMVALAKGRRKPSDKHIRLWLNKELGATIIRVWEDPPEDVFVASATTADGNFRVFDGIWEANDFHLQRILNVVATLPDDEKARTLRRQILALLKISEAVAERRGLKRFTPGGGCNAATIRIPNLARMRKLREHLCFTTRQLHDMGVLVDDLLPFLFSPNLREMLIEQPLGNTLLERRPIGRDGDRWFVLLPTAISIAIRAMVLDWLMWHGYDKSFEQNFATEYFRFLRQIPELGPALPTAVLQTAKRVAGCTVMEFLRPIDAGRYFHVLAIVDGLYNYPQSGFASPPTHNTELASYVSERVHRTRAQMAAESGFREGLSLCVGCGYGRPWSMREPKGVPEWRFAAISASDFWFLTLARDATPFHIWKLISHEGFLAENGITISYTNGLLNLYGWWSDTDFKMISPPAVFGGDPIYLAIPTDCFCPVRRKVRQGYDPHVLPMPDGQWTRVMRRSANSYFPGESDEPDYIALDAVHAGQLLGAWIGTKVVWWVAVDEGETQLPRDLVYRTWDAVINWMSRFSPVLEASVPRFPCEVMCFVLDFCSAYDAEAQCPSEERLDDLLAVAVESGKRSIRLEFRDPFFGVFRRPTNAGERAIIGRMATGVLELAGQVASKEVVEALVEDIVPDEMARYLHFFSARSFRDYGRSFDDSKKLVIDKCDEARARLGLAWLGQERHEASRYSSGNDSVVFLNRVVQGLWERLALRLRRFDRVALVEQALRHIEGNAADRARWRQTMRAMLALREDKDSTKRVAMERLARLNAADIGLRLLIEMAVCECPVRGGGIAGVLDVSPLMADALLMFQLGGFSDAIRKEVMEPLVEIDSTGDIVAHPEFHEEVAMPYWEGMSREELDNVTEAADRFYEPAEPVSTVHTLFAQSFLDAFDAEFGLSIDSARGVRDALENLAVEKEQVVLILRESEILAQCDVSSMSSAKAAKVMLEAFSLWPRKAWDVAPIGYKNRDWYPWRFGRRLSLISRPIVRLEDTADPRFAVSPGLIATAFAITLERYLHGDVHPTECRSSEMKRWVDAEVNRRGSAFAREVADMLESAGYLVRREATLDSLLNVKLDRDWGDVDVLAWMPGESVLFAIECKNSKSVLTVSDIAEHMNRFSGQVGTDGKRDDLLRHIDRCELLKREREKLARALNLGGRDVIVYSVVCFRRKVPSQFVADRFPGVAFRSVNELCQTLAELRQST